MFGYIKPFRPELKVHELEIYKSIYCGLCKQIGRSYSQISRMVLSYDMTFLALVALSVEPGDPCMIRRSCPAHPLRRRPCIKSCRPLELAADCAVLLAYYKLRDNFQDSSAIKRVVGLPAWPVLARCKRRAAKRQPQIAEIVRQMAQRQEKLEAQATASMDCACDPTARALSEIAGMLSPSSEFVPAFSRMGYMLGRYIYIIDSADDLEQDIQSNRFNPLLTKFHIDHPSRQQKTQMLEYAQQALNLTCAQLAAAFELLPFQRYKPILDNIVYLGLRYTQNQVIGQQLKQDLSVNAVASLESGGGMFASPNDAQSASVSSSKI